MGALRQMLRAKAHAASNKAWWQKQKLPTTLAQDLRDRFQQHADRCEVLRALSEQA